MPAATERTAPAPAGYPKLTDLEIKDAQLIFTSLWRDLEAEVGREHLRFPKEIILLGGAPRTVAKSSEHLETTVLDARDTKRLGLGALLSVTHGAEEPARLIIMEYKGAAAKVAPIAICGKGITFDTGGISIKPSANMDEMKSDMAGAAAVRGANFQVGEFIQRALENQLR